LVRRVLELVVLRCRSRRYKELEIVVLRHELGVSQPRFRIRDKAREIVDISDVDPRTPSTHHRAATPIDHPDDRNYHSTFPGPQSPNGHRRSYGSQRTLRRPGRPFDTRTGSSSRSTSDRHRAHPAARGAGMAATDSSTNPEIFESVCHPGRGPAGS
jgi:hypothetical protein